MRIRATGVAAVAAIITAAGMSSATYANASKKIDVPIVVHGDGRTSACTAIGTIVGLDPKGDGFLSVRSGPGGRPFREIDRRYNGQRVRICGSQGPWLAAVYAAGGELESCGVTTPWPVSQAYKGPCRHGWVHSRYVRTEASEPASGAFMQGADARAVSSSAIDRTSVTPYRLAGNARWAVLAARQNIEEAKFLAQALYRRFPDLQILESENGWFALVTGPLQVQVPGDTKDSLISDGAPADMYLSRGEKFTKSVWKGREASGTERAAVKPADDSEAPAPLSANSSTVSSGVPDHSLPPVTRKSDVSTFNLSWADAELESCIFPTSLKRVGCWPKFEWNIGAVHGPITGSSAGGIGRDIHNLLANYCSIQTFHAVSETERVRNLSAEYRDRVQKLERDFARFGWDYSTFEKEIQTAKDQIRGHIAPRLKPGFICSDQDVEKVSNGFVRTIQAVEQYRNSRIAAFIANPSHRQTFDKEAYKMNKGVGFISPLGADLGSGKVCFFKGDFFDPTPIMENELPSEQIPALLTAWPRPWGKDDNLISSLAELRERFPIVASGSGLVHPAPDGCAVLVTITSDIPWIRQDFEGRGIPTYVYPEIIPDTVYRTASEVLRTRKEAAYARQKEIERRKAAELAERTSAYGPFKAGYWQSRANGARAVGQCNPSDMVTRYRDGQACFMLHGVRDNCTPFESTFVRSRDNENEYRARIALSYGYYDIYYLKSDDGNSVRATDIVIDDEWKLAQSFGSIEQGKATLRKLLAPEAEMLFCADNWK